MFALRMELLTGRYVATAHDHRLTIITFLGATPTIFGLSFPLHISLPVRLGRCIRAGCRNTLLVTAPGPRPASPLEYLTAALYNEAAFSINR